jgi:hypothetical protein
MMFMTERENWLAVRVKLAAGEIMTVVRFDLMRVVTVSENDSLELAFQMTQ